VVNISANVVSHSESISIPPKQKPPKQKPEFLFPDRKSRAELKAERTYTMLTVEMVPGLDSGFVPGLVSSLVPLFRSRAERVREKRTMVPLFLRPAWRVRLKNDAGASGARIYFACSRCRPCSSGEQDHGR